MRSRVPKDFYRLFASKYIEYYQLALIAIYEEYGRSYSLLGFTEEECQEIIREKMDMYVEEQMLELGEEEGEFYTRTNLPSVMLRRLESWGWLRRDFDEALNQYVVSFPDYSQMFVDVFRNLLEEGDRMERGSILTIYSHLFTYYSDSEKNTDILNSALWASKSLQQMLIDMQEGMRGYFEELSGQKTFIGIQEVLINEINNSDSKKYAILTTTDSFYRYKEEIRELLDKSLAQTELRKQQLVEAQTVQQDFVPDRRIGHRDSASNRRAKREIIECEAAIDILFQIRREFDGIEKRYNQLIDQKRIFAKRAAARIRYILTEGDAKEDQTKAFVRFLDNSPKKDEILDEMSRRLGLTTPFQVIKEKSFARPRNAAKREFLPQAVMPQDDLTEEFGNFVVKPLYTHSELAAFRKENESDGVFRVTDQTVRTVEDLEKLLFVWQEATELWDNAKEVETGETFTTAEGFRYSGFSIKEERKDG